MRIGVITFHASHNYGSMLQAYALQTYLEKEGHDVTIINYRSKEQKSVYPHPLSLKVLKKPRALLGSLVRFRRTLRLVSKWNRFESFINRWLHVTKEYNTYEDLDNESFLFDAVIAGSDQIWNTIPIDFSPVYFLPFIKGVTKIAFSPSLGPTPERVDLSGFRDFLSDFSAISVREVNAIPFIQKYALGHIVEHTIDPTLLLDANDYLKMIDSKRLIKEKYILFYAPANQGNISDYLDIANTLGNESGYTVITTQSLPRIANYTKVKEYLPVGPLEFLNLIRNAEFVCGRSFHLVVFSILFRKEFYTINADYDARIHSLLGDLEIENRNISRFNVSQFSRSMVDYDIVASALLSVRKRSFSFLNQSLNG